MLNIYEKLKNDKVILMYLVVELFLYSIFLVIDLFFNGLFIISTYVKYMSVVICFLVTVYMYYRDKEEGKSRNRIKDTFVVGTGIFFTLFADWFLLIKEEFIVGLFFFLIVQFIYMLRLILLQKRYSRIYEIGKTLVFTLLFNIITAWTILRVIIFARNLFVSIEQQKEYLDPLLILGVFYFVSILHNTILSIKLTVAKTSVIHTKIFAIGMSLFLLCDINVGLYNMDQVITFTSTFLDKLYGFSSVAMWLFYLPSQVCITLSALNDQTEKNLNNS